MIEQGIVQKTEDRYAVVQIYKNGSCDGCNLCDSAGPGENKILRVVNKQLADKGDWVEVQVSTGAVITSAIMIFIVPVLFIIIGYIIGEKIESRFYPEFSFISTLSAILFLGAAILLIRRFDKKTKASDAHMPYVSRILYKGPGERSN